MYRFVNPQSRSATLAVAALLTLSACTSGMTAAVESLQEVVRTRRPVEPAKLDPNFEYLRVTRGSQVGLMWRGAVEPSPEGPVEVYYSGSGEVLRLRAGRLVGVWGVATEWRQVTDFAPAWALVVKAREPVAFARVRDVMPGYRSGVRDELALRRVTAPERTTLRGVDPNALAWFEETMQARSAFRLPGTVSEILPPALYAVDVAGEHPVVVYSEQCLAPDFCFTWQRWSAAVQQAAAKQGR